MRNPTPQGISALLRDAGFSEASEYAPGHNREGFHVIPDRLGVVLVNWWEVSGADDDDDEHATMLAAYSAAIRSAGFAVHDGGVMPTDDKNRWPDFLIVTAPESTEGAAMTLPPGSVRAGDRIRLHDSGVIPSSHATLTESTEGES